MSRVCPSCETPLPVVSIRVLLLEAKAIAEECAEREERRGKHLAASEWREMAEGLQAMRDRVW